MQLLLENFLASAQLILEAEIIERQQLEEALRELQEEIQQKDSQLEQAQRELQRAEAQVIHTEKMAILGHQVAGVAHEINNPVSFIHANLRYAREYTQELLHIIHLYAKHYPQPAAEIQSEIEAVDLDFLSEDLPRILSSIQLGTDRLREIIVSLRTFPRLNKAQMRVVDLNRGINSTLMLFHQLFHERLAGHHELYSLTGCSNAPDIEIITEYGQLPLVECDAKLLDQVFMALLSVTVDALQERAIREISQQTTNPSETATHYCPTINIRTGISLNQTRALIQIADNGSGMTEENQRCLFDFPSIAKPIGKPIDIGLSLYNSHQIVVEQHGGQLKCVSELGKGTEFTIEIPIRQSHRQSS